MTGTFGNEYCYSGGYQLLSIMYPDETSVAEARQGILRVLGLEEDAPEAVYAAENILKNMASEDQPGSAAAEAGADGLDTALGISGAW